MHVCVCSVHSWCGFVSLNFLRPIVLLPLCVTCARLVRCGACLAHMHMYWLKQSDLHTSVSQQTLLIYFTNKRDQGTLSTNSFVRGSCTTHAEPQHSHRGTLSNTKQNAMRQTQLFFALRIVSTFSHYARTPATRTQQTHNCQRCRQSGPSTTHAHKHSQPSHKHPACKLSSKAHARFLLLPLRCVCRPFGCGDAAPAAAVVPSLSRFFRPPARPAATARQ